MEENKKQTLIINGDDLASHFDANTYLSEAKENLENLKDNLSLEKEVAYILGKSVQEYHKEIEERAKSMGLTVEEYWKKELELAKEMVPKQQHFIDNSGEVIEMHRNHDGKK